MTTVEQAFRRVTIGDPTFVSAIADPDGHQLDLHRLDGRTEALLRVGALVAVDAPASWYRPAVEAALRSGARLEDLFAVLIAVGGCVGTARIVSAAPRISIAAGYDVEAALE